MFDQLWKWIQYRWSTRGFEELPIVGGNGSRVLINKTGKAMIRMIFGNLDTSTLEEILAHRKNKTLAAFIDQKTGAARNGMLQKCSSHEEYIIAQTAGSLILTRSDRSVK